MTIIGSLSTEVLCGAWRKIKHEVNSRMGFWTGKKGEMFLVHSCSLKNKDREKYSISLFSSCIVDSSCLCVFEHKHKAAVLQYLHVVIYIN